MGIFEAKIITRGLVLAYPSESRNIAIGCGFVSVVALSTGAYIAALPCAAVTCAIAYMILNNPKTYEGMLKAEKKGFTSTENRINTYYNNLLWEHPLEFISDSARMYFNNVCSVIGFF